MTNEALLEEWNNAEPVAVPPADDIIARWEKATPIDWKPGHFIPTRRNWAAMRESFAGDPLAFVLDPKLRADFEFVTAREKDPELTRKKLALANYYANMRRERVLFAYDNLDSKVSSAGVAGASNGTPSAIFPESVIALSRASLNCISSASPSFLFTK